MTQESMTFLLIVLLFLMKTLNRIFLLDYLDLESALALPSERNSKVCRNIIINLGKYSIVRVLHVYGSVVPNHYRDPLSSSIKAMELC